MQWNSSYQESVFSFANNINTIEGGSHLSGFRSALTSALNKYARDKGELKEKDENLTGEDVREGLTAVISAKLTDPQFEGQTKTKLGNPGMQGFVQSIVNARLAEFLEENPQDARRGDPQGGPGRPGARGGAQGPRPDAPQVRARELDAARQARRLLGQGPVAGGAVRGRGRLGRRLGRRAPATATRRRSCRCAARSSTSRRAASTRCSANTEIQALITAIGTGVRDEFDIDKARYHKVVLLTDADVDGAHIRTLALTLLFREMQPLIEAGYVYIAKPPLYRLTRGQKHRYIERESELEEILLGDKFEKIEVYDRYDKQFKLTEARWKRFTPAAQAVRGLGVGAARRPRPRRGRVHAAGAPARGADHQRRRSCERTCAERRHRTATPTRPSCSPRTTARSSSGRSRPRRAWRRPTTSAAPRSTRTSTAGSPTSTGSWRSSSGRRRSTSSSARTPTTRATFEELRDGGARRSRRGGSTTTASRAWARWTPRSCARRRWIRPPGRSCRSRWRTPRPPTACSRC